MCSATGNAQTEITGSIHSSQDSLPVSFASVTAYKGENRQFHGGSVSDINGLFTLKIEGGEYVLEFRYLGFKTLTKTIKIEGQNIDLGKIFITPDEKILQEVTVTAKRPLIEQKVDRLVFNANQVSFTASNAIDLLKTTPGIQVGNDGISIFGKGKVIVLINNKRINISGSDLISILNSYSAKDVNKIEVITSPSAEYEAEGNAGIINISLKPNIKDYLGNVTSLSMEYDKKLRSNVSSSLQYNKDKLSTTISIGGNLGNSYYQEKNTKFFSSSKWNSQTDVSNNNKSINMNGLLSYILSDNSKLDFNGSFSANNLSSKNLNNTNIENQSNDNTLPSNINSEMIQPIKNMYYSMSGEYEYKWGKLGKKFITEIDYLNYDFNQLTEFSANRMINGITEQNYFNFSNNQNKKISSYKGALKFYLPISKKTIWQCGFNSTYTTTRNKIDYSKYSSNEQQNDDFTYNELIYAIYTQYSTSFNSVSLHAGIRGEFTIPSISGKNRNENLKKYFQIFPNISVSYTPSQKNHFSLNMSQRIQRPSFNMLNPFVFYDNQYTMVFGKTDLKPNYKYTVSGRYTFDGSLSFMGYVMWGKDEMDQIIYMDDKNNMTKIMWENAFDRMTYGLNASYNKNWKNRIIAYLSSTLFYSETKSKFDFIPSQSSGLTMNISLNTSFVFDKANKWTGQINGSYTTKTYSSASTIDPQYNINVNLGWNPVENLKLTLGFENIISSRYSGISHSNGMRMAFDNRFTYPTIKFGMVYSIGKNISTKNSQSMDEIKSRL